MDLTIKELIFIVVALAAFFLIASSLILPFFAGTYEYGFGNQPCQKDDTGCTSGKTNIGNGYCTSPSSTVIACASCNVTAGYSTFLSSCSSLISAINGTHCYQCSSFGFKSMSIGMMLFILFIGFLCIIIAIIKILPKFGK